MRRNYNLKISHSRWIIAVGITFLTACSLPQRAIVSQVDRHNEAIEEVQNRMLLLNILRAAKQQPTYFTALTVVRGDATLTAGSGNVTVPFGGGGTEAYSAVPNASLSIKPSFDMAVLDTQEFHKGFLQPVTPETLAFFLDQGWPRQLVLHLFVREIRFSDGSRVTNTPIGDDAAFKRFGMFLDSWVKEGDILVEAVPKTECLGPDITLDKVPTPEKLLALQQAGFVIKSGPCTAAPVISPPSKDTLHFARVTKELELRIRPRGASTLATPPEPKKTQAEQPDRSPQVFSIQGPRSARPPVAPEAPSGTQDAIALRSPEAMVYYLGELIRRQQLDSSWDPLIRVGRAFACPSQSQPSDLAEAVLFSVDAPLKKNQSYTVVAEFEGQTYGIPRREWTCASAGGTEDRSLHAMRLLSQVIALQKSGQSFPAPQTLRVVD